MTSRVSVILLFDVFILFYFTSSRKRSLFLFPPFPTRFIIINTSDINTYITYIHTYIRRSNDFEISVTDASHVLPYGSSLCRSCSRQYLILPLSYQLSSRSVSTLQKAHPLPWVPETTHRILHHIYLLMRSLIFQVARCVTSRPL